MAAPRQKRRRSTFIRLYSAPAPVLTPTGRLPRIDRRIERNLPPAQMVLGLKLAKDFRRVIVQERGPSGMEVYSDDAVWRDRRYG
jgi:hypothetical protein